MALINCPECEKEVSSTAKACPGCGAPIRRAEGEGVKYCKKCDDYTVHSGPKTAHVLHFIATIFTGGFWALFWLIIALNNKTKVKCTACGRMVGVTG